MHALYAGVVEVVLHVGTGGVLPEVGLGGDEEGGGDGVVGDVTSLQHQVLIN